MLSRDQAARQVGIVLGGGAAFSPLMMVVQRREECVIIYKIYQHIHIYLSHIAMLCYVDNNIYTLPTLYMELARSELL